MASILQQTKPGLFRCLLGVVVGDDDGFDMKVLDSGFRKRLPAPATPNVANQHPCKHTENNACEHAPKNKYVHRIHQDELAAHGIETVKTANHLRQRKQVSSRHLKHMLLRMVFRFPRKRLPRCIQLDMAAQDETDRAIANKSRY